MLTKPPTLLFVHGWGFDGTVWDTLRAALPEWPHALAEACYFSKGTEAASCNDQDHRHPRNPPDHAGRTVDRTHRRDIDAVLSTPFVLIGHSYGFMRGLAGYLDKPSCLGLISINGFPRFCADEHFPEGVARRVIDRMLSRLNAQPRDVVEDFRKRCGADAAVSPPQRERLAQDLQAMRDGDERQRLQASGLPLLILAGKSDPIVTAAMTHAAFAARTVPDAASLGGGHPADTQIDWHDTGDHLLPVSDPVWCAGRIKRFLDRIATETSPQHAAFLRNAGVAARFGKAAASYDDNADVQREAASRLAERIAALPLPARPRILEIGCGTGLLTRALVKCLPSADWTVTDIAEPMVRKAQAEAQFSGSVRFLVMDGEHPSLPVDEQYDLICSSLAIQWFNDLDGGLARLARHLAPGGHLAIATLACDTFIEWRQAHAACGLDAATPVYPVPERIGARLSALQGEVRSEHIVHRHADGMAFLRRLRRIGADTPAQGSSVLSAAALRRVLARFTRDGAAVTYHLAYGVWRRPPVPSRGVFVTGTDTGIGKTLTAATLVRAWQADYWKPCQTGLDSEAGDTDTVAQLAQVPRERLHPPAYELQAPLSPWDAARHEGVTIDMARFTLPRTNAPLVVEGAGGLFVPITDTVMMIDLIGMLGLPVVLVARSGLGTINHTLLSLEALRSRGLSVLGVVMSGVASAGNKHAIERFGRVKVLSEMPFLEHIDTAAVDGLARGMPGWDECESGGGGPDVAP